ncbi:heterokaryon incompatibility protein-domain-containing protein, partial [Leptodontidium sp. MPI-SDFR-AT-0119]
MEIANLHEPGGYQYTPLPDPDHIRLLTLQPRSDGIQIKCRISHEKVTSVDVVSYEALSYMWSGPENPETIQLEGQQHSVRENLWQALSHLRLPRDPRVLWVDAICINQSDIEERNQQVARMSRIYRCASQVIIWLGLADEQTEAAFSTLKPIHRHSLIDFNVQEYRNVERLLSKQYWSRLWIIQEIYHATDIIIYCGHLQLQWPPLHHVGITIRINQSIGEFDYSDEHSVDAVRKSIYDCMAFPLCLNETRRCRSSEDRNIALNKNHSSLFDLCIKHGQAQCEDPRDKVYGLQSMAQTCCREAVPIDYSLSLPDISAMVVSH